MPQFALQIVGDALAPRFVSGQIVIVDTDAQPSGGSGIATEWDGQLICLLVNADEDAFDNRGGCIERGAFFTIGVIVDTEGERLPAVQ